MSVTIADDMYEVGLMYGRDYGSELMWAVVEYSETGAEPDVGDGWHYGDEPVWYPTFWVLKKRIEMSAEAHERGRKMALARWGNKDDAQASDKHHAQASCTSTMLSKDKVSKDKVSKDIRTEKLAEAHRGFEAPSLDEVKAYAETNGLKDAEGFFSYYDAQGWVTSAGLPITNWQSKLMGWSSSTRRKDTRKTPSKKYEGVV